MSYVPEYRTWWPGRERHRAQFGNDREVAEAPAAVEDDRHHDRHECGGASHRDRLHCKPAPTSTSTLALRCPLVDLLPKTCYLCNLQVRRGVDRVIDGLAAEVSHEPGDHQR
jgi:hypothetical protein